MENLQTELLPESDIPEKSRPGYLQFAVDILEIILLSFIIYAGINIITARIRIDGTSMEPSLHDGEYVIVDKVTYKIRQPGLGDVIVFHNPRDPKEEYIKRVIGQPGDRVEINHGQVYINGQPIQEPYIAAPPVYPGSWVVPQNSLFVLGDNRNNSSDSHTWGSVPMDYVIGKAVFIYWPPHQMGAIEHSAHAAP